MSLFAYIRVSTTRQGSQGSSLQEQRSAIERYVAQRGLRIANWFEEQETAAKHGRPVFRKMIKALERGQADGIVIHKIDRSARNLRDWADLGELIDRGVDIHFAHESLDMKSRGGRLAADIQAVVAADYIRNLREEVLKGFYGRLRQGLYPLPAPVGYLDQGGGKPKIPDPVMGPIVARLFETYATGKINLIDLADEAYRLGLRSKRGKRVNRNRLSELLNNEFYTGVIHIHRTGERFSGIHEPLVSSSLFRTVQDVLHGRTQHKKLRHRHVFRRFIRCLSCGYNLTGETQKGHVYYRCHSRDCPPTSIREDVVMAQVVEALARLRFAPEDYQAFIDEFAQFRHQAHADAAQQARQTKLRLGKLSERLAMLTDAFLDGDIERDHFHERKASLIGERLELEEILRQLEAGANPKLARAEKYFEPIRRLNEAPIEQIRADRDEIVDLLKSLTSNLEIEVKSLLFNWKNAFRVFVDEGNSPYGGPCRDTVRTSETEDNSTTKSRPSTNRLLREFLNGLPETSG